VLEINSIEKKQLFVELVVAGQANCRINRKNFNLLGCLRVVVYQSWAKHISVSDVVRRCLRRSFVHE
jgi:hypothetical protein